MPAIQERRERKGWTRPELAEAAGVNASTVWRVETGRHEPSQPILRITGKMFPVRGCKR